MSEKLKPSTRELIAAALDEAPPLDDDARLRMRTNVLLSLGATAAVLGGAAAATKSAATAASSSATATTSIPAAAVGSASLPAAGTTVVTTATATKVVGLSLFAKAVIGVSVGGLVTAAAIAQRGPSTPPTPSPTVTAPTAPPTPKVEAPARAEAPMPIETATEAPAPTEAPPAQPIHATPSETSARVVPPPKPTAAPSASAPPVATTAPTATDFSKEVDTLDRARAALASGDAARTLAVLDEGSPSTAFVEERQALRVVALCSAGRRDEGRAELDKFRAAFPRSLQTARATRACEDPSKK